MLVDSVKASDIALSLKTRAEYHPFPRACEREQWDKLPNEAKWFYKNAANALKKLGGQYEETRAFTLPDGSARYGLRAQRRPQQV